MKRRWTVSDPQFDVDQLCPLHAVYPWSGHRNFAYDLVAFVRPRRIVELGTHWGTSFFAFVQAVRDHGLPTECIAVDTWQGDEHTGPYGSEVFEHVQQALRQYYPDVNVRLLKMRFAEAREQIEDGSIDILHIDGCHNYDAVREDFETWLGKLRPDGVVLLHDVAEDCGYGSARFWQEIREQYPSFAFPHSWGLGVVFPRGRKLYDALRAQNIDDKIPLYTFKAEARLAAIQVRDLSQMVRERDQTIADLTQHLEAARRLAQERYAAIEQQSQMIAERDAHIDELRRRLEAAEALAVERYGAIEQQSRMIAERDAQIQELTQRLAAAEKLALERYAAIEQQSQLISQRDARIEDLTRRLEAAEQLARERYDAIGQQSQMIAERDATIEELRRRLEAAEALAVERYAAIEQQSQMIAERDATIEELTQRLAAAEKLALERYDAIEQQSRMIAERDEAIAALRAALDEQQRARGQLEQHRQELHARLSQARAECEALRSELAELRSLFVVRWAEKLARRLKPGRQPAPLEPLPRRGS